jgi:hypothetical protein
MLRSRSLRLLSHAFRQVSAKVVPDCFGNGVMNDLGYPQSMLLKWNTCCRVSPQV